MKFETKELVKWCISLLEDYRALNMSEKRNFRAVRSDKEIDNCEGSIKFLKSLPEIESHLCRGGYIQDKNGTPCCEGDLIKATADADGYEVQGFLTWENYCFCLYDKEGCCNHVLCPTYIYEKVEE